jgi:adenine/guanine phosphoribosyltransferase-like PRPP-binding protein
MQFPAWWDVPSDTYFGTRDKTIDDLWQTMMTAESEEIMRESFFSVAELFFDGAHDKKDECAPSLVDLITATGRELVGEYYTTKHVTTDKYRSQLRPHAATVSRLAAKRPMELRYLQGKRVGTQNWGYRLPTTVADLDIQAVCGVLCGGFEAACVASRVLEVPIAWIWCSTTRNDLDARVPWGAQALIGRNVLVVDDIIDKGTTLPPVLHAVQRAGAAKTYGLPIYNQLKQIPPQLQQRNGIFTAYDGAAAVSSLRVDRIAI